MTTSELISILVDRLAEHGDQQVFVSNIDDVVPLFQVSEEDGLLILLRTFFRADLIEEEART